MQTISVKNILIKIWKDYESFLGVGFEMSWRWVGIKLSPPRSCLGLVRIILGTSNLVGQYTVVSVVYIVSESVPFGTKVLLIFFAKNQRLISKRSAFTQSNIVRAVLDISSFCLQFL